MKYDKNIKANEIRVIALIILFVNLSYGINFNGVIMICIVQITICIPDTAIINFSKALIFLLFWTKMSLFGNIVSSFFRNLVSLPKTLNLSYVFMLLSINSVRDFAIIFITFRLCIKKHVVLFSISKVVNSNETKATVTYTDAGNNPSILI